MSNPIQPPAGFTPYQPSGTMPDFDGSANEGPMLLPDEGTLVNYDNLMASSDVRSGLIAKCIDGVYYLWKNVGALLLAGYHGDVFDIGDGNPAHTSALGTFLHLLADYAVKRDADNVLSGKTDFQDNATFEKAIYVAAGGYISRPAVAVSTSALTLTMDASAHSEYIAEAWAGASGALVTSLTPYGGTDNPELTLTFHPVDPSSVAEAGNQVLCGIGSITWRWSGAAWKIRAAQGNVAVQGS